MQKTRGRINSWIDNVSPVKFFIITAAVFGLAFLLITPPFQGADEQVHFLRAYQVSEGNFVIDKTAGGQAGGSLPSSLGKVIDTTDTPAIQFYPQLKYIEGRTHQALHISLNPDQRSVYNFSTAAGYSPVPYIFSSSAIFVGRIVKAPPMTIFYMARLGSLISWILLVGLAIYLMPRRKWVLVMLGLLPMALFQAATINGDAITVGSFFLFLALILRLRERPGRLRTKDLAALFVAGLVMAMGKQVMPIFLPLVLLLRNNSFKSRRWAYGLKVLLIAIPFLGFAVWYWVIHGIDISSTYSNHQNPTAQMKFIIKNPYSFINVLWNTFFYSWGDGITRSFIGVFGWADAPLSEVITTIGYVGLFLLAVANTTARPLKWLANKEKILLVGLSALYLLAVSAALYIYYSPVGFKIIVGLQGRYFLPAAVILVPVVYGGVIVVKRQFYRKLAVGLPIFLLVASTITLYVRYFVNNV